MAPQYKLYYFNAMSLAEPIRLILAHAKVDYEDVRIEREDWPKKKETIPWGKVPALELADGKFISQSSAIIRYLANKYDLLPKDDFLASKCDEYAGVVNDLRQEGVKHFHAPNDEVKIEIKRKIVEESFPYYCKHFLEIIKSNGSGYLVGTKMTYADILLAYIVGQIMVLLEPTLLQKYPEMTKYVEFINGHSGIKEWIAKRPNTPF